MMNSPVPSQSPSPPAYPEDAVRSRYAAAAREREEALCCPIHYSPRYLEIIPQEILDRDYGCGDPSEFVHSGDTVVDLGAGGGKLCYILAQIVGANGRVIGVDCNTEMLELARRYQQQVADQLNYANVDFRYGLIQDLQLDLELLNERLKQQPVSDSSGWLALRSLEEQLRNEKPLIADQSVDCVVSNCVLNLVRQADRTQLFHEIFRVLKNGGRAVISDIVSDETVPESLQQDSILWSGCLSGAFPEDHFLQAFEQAGFHGIELVKRQSAPWRIIEGIEFRSVTIVAWKGKQGPCLERQQALIYRGPFRTVHDDDGHVFQRGQRTAVCDKTFQLLQKKPYQGLFESIEPLTEIPLEVAAEFNCRRSRLRHPRETKGLDYSITTDEPGSMCSGDDPCC